MRPLDQIPKTLVSKLYESMPKRTEKCISNAGFENIDIMVLFGFSVGHFAYEITLDERSVNF